MNAYLVRSGAKELIIEARHQRDAQYAGAKALGFRGSKIRVVNLGKLLCVRNDAISRGN